jgi:hypothetical protein
MCALERVVRCLVYAGQHISSLQHTVYAHTDVFELGAMKVCECLCARCVISEVASGSMPIQFRGHSS